MKRTLFLTILLAFCATAVTAEPEKRPTKIWNRTGPLGETPKHVTEAFPFSDQENEGGWVKFEPMSDEFDGKQLDLKKWALGIEGWKGRQPALFSEKNVTVSDGKLHLTMRKEKLPPEDEKQGYHDYTSAALHSKARSSYGCYEVKAKPMNSGGSSSFWFHDEGKSDWRTEIDVFEIGGKAKGFEHKLNITVHVWQTPQEKKHWQVGGAWIAPWRLADDYHVYGFEWGKEELKFYVDGVVVRTVENTHWHQPLFLTFDSETMPDWMGMPKDEDLPSTFSVEYVRAWKRKASEPKPQARIISHLESRGRTVAYLALWTLRKNGFDVSDIQFDKPYAEAQPKLRRLADTLRQLPASKLTELDESLKYHTRIYSPIWSSGGQGWEQ
jgi:beta-glucanase (GH16 family)